MKSIKFRNAIAAVLFLPVIAFSQTTAQAWFDAANAQFKQKNFQAAIKSYGECIKLNPKASGCFGGRAASHFNLKNYESTVADATSAMTIDPKDSYALPFRADSYNYLGKHELALADYTKLIGTKPTDTLYLVRGELYRKLDRFDEALADFAKVITMSPSHAKVYNFRGDVYREQKKYDLALADYTKDISINPEVARGYLERGLVYEKLEKFNEAIADYSKAIQLYPQYEWAYNNRGVIYEKQKKYEAAIADYTKAIEFDPKIAMFYRNRGYSSHLAGRYEPAIADFKKAIEIDPKFAWAYNNLGNTYLAQKNYTEAHKAFAKAIEISPKYVAATYNAGLVYRDQKLDTKAVEWFTKAIALDDKYEDAYKQRAEAYLRQNRLTDAKKDFERLVELDPKNAAHHVDRGAARYKMGEREEALADYKRALELDPRQRYAILNIGGYEYNKNNFPEALKHFAKAIEIDPKFSRAYEARAKVYCKQGRIDLAAADEKKAVEFGGTVESPCESSAAAKKVESSPSLDKSGFATFKAAMDAGKRLETQTSFDAAAGVYENAFALAVTDAERAQALIASSEAAAKYEVGSSKTRDANLQKEAIKKKLTDSIEVNYLKILRLEAAPANARLNAHRELAKIYDGKRQYALAVGQKLKIFEFTEVSAAEKSELSWYIAQHSADQSVRVKHLELLLADKKTTSEKKAEIYYLLSGIYSSRKETAKLIEAQSNLIAIKGAPAKYLSSAYSDIAEREIKAQKYAEAEANVAKIFDLKDLSSEAKGNSLFNLARKFTDAKQFDIAKRLFEQVLTLPELREYDKTNANYILANLYFNEKNYAKAHEFYDKLPNNYDARVNKIKTFVAEGKKKEASEFLVSTLELVGQQFYSAATQQTKQYWFERTNALLKDSFGLANEYESTETTKPYALAIYKAMYKLVPANSTDATTLKTKISALESAAGN